ncbi:hypothetical protein [Rhizobium mongolense]|uniref:hypothetical protein n=1 Tax=Rhizobium mongolense TaxID=57676 RepID=UPI0034A243E9
METLPIETAAPRLSVIPVLVTGIEPRRVYAVNDSLSLAGTSFAAKASGAPDPCEKHSDEGMRFEVIAHQQRGSIS